MMGGSLPSVFHTAPPQPSSKARMTCNPEFEGGADASQNGFGDLMPAQSAERSGAAIRSLDRGNPVLVAGRRRDAGLQRLVDRPGRAFAVGGGVDDLFASV